MEIDDYWVLCPYCQSENGDLIDYEEDEKIEFTCEDCNKKFTGRKVVKIDFRTESDCELNNEKHEKGEYKCKKCDVYN